VRLPYDCGVDSSAIGAGLQLHLDEQQAELLQEILDRAFRDLRYEIVGTDRSEYKRQLREREAVLRSILDLSGGPLPDRG
jgi:hypothetical protein